MPMRKNPPCLKKISQAKIVIFFSGASTLFSKYVTIFLTLIPLYSLIFYMRFLYPTYIPQTKQQDQSDLI